MSVEEDLERRREEGSWFLSRKEEEEEEEAARCRRFRSGARERRTERRRTNEDKTRDKINMPSGVETAAASEAVPVKPASGGGGQVKQRRRRGRRNSFRIPRPAFARHRFFGLFAFLLPFLPFFGNFPPRRKRQLVFFALSPFGRKTSRKQSLRMGDR